MTTQRIAIAGSTGRMGRALIDAVVQAGDFQLKAALERPDSPFLGKDAGELVGSPCGVRISADLERSLADCDVLVDFTRPEATLKHLEICGASRNVAVVMAPNMSVGVNLTFKLVELTAKVLNEGYDVEIIEAHHRHKVDAPSGTALRMGEVIAHTLGRNLAECAVYGREGVTGERQAATIGFATVRGGD